jgi:hypothetical protein
MRIHAGLLLGMCCLALAVPAVVVAGPLGDDDAAYAPPGAESQPQPARHHHHGLFGRRHCVECQRAYVKAHDGVDVPAPPSMPPGAVVQGPVLAAQVSNCATCQGNAMVSGPVMMADSRAPGYAVVGGPGAMASADAPGYAVVGDTVAGPEPAPIGVSRAGQAGLGDPRMAGMAPRPGAGPYDPSVVPTSIPPAQVGMEGPQRQPRYKVVAHMLGVPMFGARRRAEEEKERQKHAAIAYDQPGAKVTELPASMVYGATGH